MHEEDLKMMKQAEDILEKELRAEVKKVVDAGQFTPGQTNTISDAVCLMLKMKEYEEWLERDNSEGYSFRHMRNPVNGQYMGRYGYPMYRSGHSTRDRMVACLEDLMGEAKNEYEAQMISDAIRYVQNGER